MRLALLCLYLVPLLLCGGAPAALAAEKTCANGLGTKFILIPSGSFTMGADKNSEDAGPQHRVSISNGYTPDGRDDSLGFRLALTLE
jgi:formylglycine-generating enzyme required for sulfatase activity